MSRNGEIAPASPKVPGGEVFRRLAFPIACTVLTIFVVVESASLGLWLRYGPGPGLFPAVMAIVILLTAWCLFATSAPAENVKKRTSADSSEVHEGEEAAAWLSARVWKVIACTAVGLATIEFWDLVAGTAVIVGSLLILVERTPLIRSVAYTAVFCLGVWAIFDQFFGVT